LREKYGFEKKSRKKDSSGKNMMRKNVEDLNERGEALRNTENAAEEMAGQAQSLASIASKIKSRQKKRSFFGL